MIVRLDPRHPAAWRSPTTVQFGFDAVAAVVPDASGVTARLIAALAEATALPVEALRVAAAAGGAPASAADDFVAAAAAALLPAASTGTAVPTARVAVDGSGPEAAAIASALAFAGAELVHDDRADCAVVVGRYAIEPERYGRWLRRDIPHLGVVFGDVGVRIGPFVEPGDGPCLRCVDLAKTDADEAWPVLAAQLAGRDAWTTLPLARPAALRVATAVVDRLLADDRSFAERSVFIDAASFRLSAAPHCPHPRCGCRGLPGTETPTGAPAAVPARPSSARVARERG